MSAIPNTKGRRDDWAVWKNKSKKKNRQPFFPQCKLRNITKKHQATLQMRLNTGSKQLILLNSAPPSLNASIKKQMNVHCWDPPERIADYERFPRCTKNKNLLPVKITK